MKANGYYHFGFGPFLFARKIRSIHQIEPSQKFLFPLDECVPGHPSFILEKPRLSEIEKKKYSQERDCPNPLSSS